jgi:hypothetical protein
MRAVVIGDSIGRDFTHFFFFLIWERSVTVAWR